MAGRDDFSAKTKEILAKRVGYKCSNPDCRKMTIGLKDGENSAMGNGIAAHITAASSGGPRYCSSMSPEERKDFDNGIWLCSNCSILIDRDEKKYTVELLKEWKKQAEKAASDELTGKKSNIISDANATKIFVKEWTQYPNIENASFSLGIEIMLFEKGGVVNDGDRWTDYISKIEEWKRPYIEAIRNEILKRKIKLTGKQHQQDIKGVPRFNNGKMALFSYRAWGDLMAATWAEYENQDYSYLYFYM